MRLTRSTFAIPQHGEGPIRWDYYVLQAARGSVKVPRMLLLALPVVVGERLGVAAAAVEQGHIDRFVDALPSDPMPLVRALLKNAEVVVPVPGTSEPRLSVGERTGHRREAVGSPDLLHDAALTLLAGYGRAGFFAAFDGAADGPGWDATAAVAAMMYLMLGRTMPVDSAPGVIRG